MEDPNCDRINTFSDAWTWHNDTMDAAPATFVVAAAGVHTVNVWMREDGFFFDKIFLTTNAAYPNPGAGTGPAPSPQIADPRPQPPTLSGTPGPASAMLSWTPGGGGAPTSYNVLRSTVAGGPYAQIANVTGTTYTDTGLTFGTTYYYVVQAVNAAGTSANSNQVAISPLAPPPRIGDNDEGLWGDKCACGSSIPPGTRALAAAALAALGLLLLAKRR